jgi:hypothetical protein
VGTRESSIGTRLGRETRGTDDPQLSGVCVYSLTQRRPRRFNSLFNTVNSASVTSAKVGVGADASASGLMSRSNSVSSSTATGVGSMGGSIGCSAEGDGVGSMYTGVSTGGHDQIKKVVKCRRDVH